LASDLGRAPPSPTPPSPPAFTWTGFTIGGDVGMGWSRDRGQQTCVDPNGTIDGDGCQNIPLGARTGSGGFAGAQIGYNHQFDRIVIGVETDFQWANIRGSTRLDGPFPSSGGGEGIAAAVWSSAETLEWFGTVRPRIGYVVFDRALVYATGGLAYGRLSASSNYSTPDPGQPTSRPASLSATRTGWTLGGGVELAISSHVSVKLEGLYMDLGRANTLGPEVPLTYSPAGYAYGKAFEFRDTIVRGGVNYRF
jgi:outer membrane immunogenic protein